MQYAWTCRCCGKEFNDLPLSYMPPPPAPWLDLSAEERATRAKIDQDVCIIDGEQFFVRCCLEVPIVGQDQTLIWGVWMSVTRSSLDRIVDLWSVEVPDDEPPIFGWLCNTNSCYPNTYGLAGHLYLQSDGKRPSVLLEPTDHPLSLEQQNGITLDRAEEIAVALMPRH
jgi:hypothetical protein